MAAQICDTYLNIMALSCHYNYWQLRTRLFVAVFTFIALFTLVSMFAVFWSATRSSTSFRAVGRLSRPSPGTSDKVTRWNPTQSVQDTPAIATWRNSGEFKSSTQTGSEFQPAITKIIDVSSEGRIYLDNYKFPCKIFSDSFTSAAQLEDASICGQHNVSKNMCTKKNIGASVSESVPDNNRLGSEMAVETTSESLRDPDQAFSKLPIDEESSTVTCLHFELCQKTDPTSAEPLCHVSSKTGHGPARESPMNCTQINTYVKPRSFSQADIGITQVPSGVSGDESQSSNFCGNMSTHTSSAESKTSDSSGGSHSGGSDFNNQVLKDKADLSPEATLHDSDCPAESGTVEHQLAAGPPKLNALSFQSISIIEEEPQPKAFRSESLVPWDRNVALKDITKFQSTAIVSSFLNSNRQLDVNICHELSRVSDRMHNAAQYGLSGSTIQTVQCAKEKNIISCSKSSVLSLEQPCPSITQRTFMELQLSPSPLFKYNKEVTSKPSKDSKIQTYARLSSKLSPISRAEITNGIAKREGFDHTEKAQLTTADDPKPSQVPMSGETLKFSTSRPNCRTMERWGLSKDVTLSAGYKPFSVQHKIKSYESLANLDKHVAKSSNVHTFAVAYTASLNQRISGYMDSVNSVDRRGHQRNSSSYNNCLTSVASLSPPLRKSAGNENQNAPDGTISHNTVVLRKKHGRLPTRMVHQSRALSMPNLEKLCTDDFSGGNTTAGNKNDPSVCLTVAPKSNMTNCFSPAAMFSSGDDATSENTPQGPSDTRRPGWSIRLKELVEYPVSQRKLQTLLTSQTAQSYVMSLLEETKAHSEVINNNNTLLVVLNKEEGAGLGFSVAGGADIDQKKITVHQIFTRGAASLEGTIQSGDTILSINGTSLKGKSHVAVVSCLHEARYSKQALVVIWRNEECKRNISDKDCRLQTKGNKLVEACADVV